MGPDERTRAYDFGGDDPDTRMRRTDEVDLGATRSTDAPTEAFPSAASGRRDEYSDVYRDDDARTAVFDRSTDRPELRATANHEPRTEVFDSPAPATPEEPTRVQRRAATRRSEADDIMFEPEPEPAPVRGRRAPAPALQAVPRDPGPHGGVRVLAVLLALVLSLGGALAVTVALLLAIARAVASVGESLVGADVVGMLLPDTEALQSPWLLAAVVAIAVVLFLLAAFTSRLSGTGVGVAGVVLLVFGVLGIALPEVVGGWVTNAGFLEPLLGLEAGTLTAISSMAAPLSVVLGVVLVIVGGVFLATAASVHGARHAGWRRGTGG